MGNRLRTARRFRHLGLVFGLISLGIAIFFISATWGKLVGLSPEDTIYAEPLLVIPQFLLYIFILGIIGGSALTSYVILELVGEEKEDQN